MTPFDQPDRSDFESRLSDLLNKDVKATAAETDTAAQFQRLDHRLGRRRAIVRATAVAAVLVIVGGTIGASRLIGGSAHAGRDHPAGKATPTTHRRSETFGPVTPLPADVVATATNGPQDVGFAAFGVIWTTGMTNSSSVSTLIRVSADGRHVLSQATYPGTNQNLEGPVRIGNAVVVADLIGNYYTVFDRNGHKIGNLPNLSMGAAAGDAAGGWVTTAPDQIAHVDATGLHIDHRYTLPGNPSISWLSLSPGVVWAINSTNNQLLRIDASTGTVTGHTELPSAPVQVVYEDDAVYVTSQDDALRRIDPATMQITATTFSRGSQGWPFIATTSGNQLWVSGDSGAIARLDPISLKAIRNLRVFQGDGRIGVGAVVTPSRIYLSEHERIFSFPR